MYVCMWFYVVPLVCSLSCFMGNLATSAKNKVTVRVKEGKGAAM